MVNLMSKKRLVITSVISIILISLLFIGSTYSIFTTGDIDENQNVYTTGSLDVTYTLSDANVALGDITPTSVDDCDKIKPYRISVTNNGTVDYKFNIVLVDTTAVNKIDVNYIMVQIGKYDVVSLGSTGDNVLKKDIVVGPGDTVDIDVRVFISDEVVNSQIGKSFYAKLSVEGVAVNFSKYSDDKSLLLANYTPSANEPKLDSGMIPVVYDDKKGRWVKADYNNVNSSWYDYENKMWANAVLVSDTSRNVYQTADVGTVIIEDDILGFYVWVPRFKYRIWNISRQVNSTSSYEYKRGIEIKFEEGVVSSGNVECNYDVTSGDEENLSDNCVYNKKDTITSKSDNSVYLDAWYTHPAFKFNNNELTGFWVGKFETGGVSSAPVVKPDVISLRNQNVDEQFSTSQIINSYGLTDNLNAKMLTNLEWGALVYLTYSKYGLCNADGCRDIYFNNSSGYYTGRSFGNVFSGEAYNDFGNYSYDGYLINSDGTKSNVKDVSRVASNTGNISGVYDMVGGAYEYVMGVMTTNLDIKDSLKSNYCDIYSYGSNYNNQLAFNRTRLGDAIGEFFNYENQSFLHNDKEWLVRGGSFDSLRPSILSFMGETGEGSEKNTFRSSLS